MSLAEYRNTVRETADARQIEHRLLAEATSALEAHAEGDDRVGLIHAVHRNRQVWGAFLGDLARDNNTLPDSVRANLISLALWVQQHSGEVMAKRETVEPLIEINRLVMDGLRNAQAAA